MNATRPSRPRAPLRAVVADVLHRVPDPEIPIVSVVDLGIVRDIISEGRTVAVEITPTYTGCPATEAIERAIRAALDAAGLRDVALRTVLSPAWTTDWISDEGREKLRAYGIAPPPKGAAAASLKNAEPAECPRCGSADTEEISRFASTPCKALWRCRACAEPFDRFKCH
ncbi:MAG: 1,2-phenylacetyl-CoA epoxidase subunit PaaD [Alphaproteobacteria bacterium]